MHTGNRPKLFTPPPPRPPCVHLGPPTGATAECDQCGAHHQQLPTLGCALHGECTADKPARRIVGGASEKLAWCRHCDEYETRHPVSYTVLGGLLPGHNLNCSVVVHRGRRLLAYRHKWLNARIYIAELGDDWRPIRNFAPAWDAPASAVAHEDPRLFVYRDKLHCSYTAYDGVTTSVAYVRLRDDLSGCEGGWAPTLPGRQAREKNWVFFDHDGELLAVYRPSPHVILRVVGDWSERAYGSDWRPAAWGDTRGGASPVRVGDEYYHWFHTQDRTGLIYTAGLYTFEARPTFRPTRIVRRPLVWPTERLNSGLAVAYPGGAVLDGATWRVACGYQNNYCRIYSFDAAEIERELVAV